MTQISIVSIPVSDQEQSKSFYADVVGFDLLADDLMGPDQRWVQLVPRDGGASITLVTWFEQMAPGSVQGIVLETDDVDRDHAALRERGLKISDLREAPWARFAEFKDPDGNGWVLQQRLSEA